MEYIIFIAAIIFIWRLLKAFKDDSVAQEKFMSEELSINKPWENLSFNNLGYFNGRYVEGNWLGKDVMAKSFHEDDNRLYIDGIEISSQECFELTGTYPVFIYMRQIENWKKLNESAKIKKLEEIKIELNQIKNKEHK